MASCSEQQGQTTIPMTAAMQRKVMSENLKDVRHKLFVMSGKGGVGKSSVTVNLAAALAAQGYALEAAPRRGYRLAGGDPFCAEAVGEYDAPIFLYDTLESSNRTAKTLALEGAPHGTMVLAGQQTAGRGRLGRRFESPAGKGVYLSLVLRPSLPMTRLFYTSGAAGAKGSVESGEGRVDLDRHSDQ